LKLDSDDSKIFLDILEQNLDSANLAVIGLGNPDRADDGAGIVIASKLKEKYPQSVFLETDRSVEGIVLELLERNSIKTFLFLDASDFGGKPGEIKLFSHEDAKRFIPAVSTHKVPITFLIEIILKQGRKAFLLGIQPGSLEFMGKISPAVEKTVSILENLLIKFIKSSSAD